MALSFDDKILGEKIDNYCSSSEDDYDESNSDGEIRSHSSKQMQFIPETQIDKYPGFCTNTGPKGVINDWRRFKQLESEARDEAELEKMNLVKKLSVTCRSHLDDEEAKDAESRDTSNPGAVDPKEDEFIKAYRERRMEEMRQLLRMQSGRYGEIFQLTRDSFLSAVDKSSATVIVHVYDEDNQACRSMYGCLRCLVKQYPHVKFCQILSSDAQMSERFARDGVPALLVYRGGELVGNFVSLSREFGDDFFADEVELFLQERGFLEPFGCTKKLRDKQDEDDLELD